MRLFDLYHSAHFHVIESEGYLLVGFKADSVSFIVKEIWNDMLLTREEAEACYTDFQRVGEFYGCRHFRIVAHGGYLPEALSFELHGLAVCGEEYIESLHSGKHIELFPHNEAAYRAIEMGFSKHRIGTVVQATGTGKSFLIARYITSHANDRILVIAPNTTILDEIRRAIGSNLSYIIYTTFQALIHSRESGASIRVDHILIDEFHHFGAEVWGQAVRDVIEQNPEARVLGTSATPIRPEGMIDTVDVYFEGNLFYELSLPKAWYYKILPVPVLVQSVYGLNGQLEKLQQTLNRLDCTDKRRKEIQRKLDAARVDFTVTLGAPQLVKQFLPVSVRKLLVFCRDKEDLQQMLPEVMGWLKEAGLDAVSFEVHNGKSEGENHRTLKAFRQETGWLHVLFSINMLMEGLHVEGVDAALFLRRTESYVVTLQQLGRCLKAGSHRKPVILDFVNNLSGKSVYDVMARDMERMSVVRSPKGFEGISHFEVTGFFSDIQKRVSEILAELEPWQMMYDRLLEYRVTEKDWPSATEGKLGLWCHTQRMSRKRGALLDERIRKLEAIDFEWEQQDSRWMRMFEEVKAFYAEKEYWPKRGEGALSVWCNTQRQARRNGKLTKERIRKLDGLGFQWKQDLDGDWMDNYNELKTFQAKHKRFPKASEGSLGAWCCTQRKSRKQEQLSEERIRKLDAIGFIWSSDEVWEANYEQLLSFHSKHLRWPTSREGKLGSWCFVQRKTHKKGELSEERVRKLEAIGFPF